MTKEHTPSPSSWAAFVKIVKEAVGRELQASEVKEMMNFYINGKKAEEYLEENK